MAKSPKTPSGKAKSRAKSAKKVVEADIVEAEIVDAETVADAAEEAGGSVPIETVPEDSDYDTTVAKDIEAAVSDKVDDAADAVSDSSDPKSDTSDPTDGAAASEDAAENNAAEENAAKDNAEAPVETSTTAAPVAASTSGSGFFGFLIGGLLAGAIGFAAAMLLFPQGWQEQNVEVIEALQSDLSTQSETIATQSETLAAQTAAQEALSGEVAALGESLGADVGGLREDIAASAENVTALSARIDSLTRGDGTTKLPDDIQILLNAQKEEISALRAEVSDLTSATKAQVEELTASAKAQMDAAAAEKETAEQAEARVKARGALQRVRLALVSGDPFADALPEIAGAVEVPEALQAVADSGAPTAADVQAGYPVAARSALAQAMRAEAGDDTQSKLQLFFKDQLGARSLTPRDGDDADAVLSRAEAAVKAEDYAAALQEIDALPDPAKEEFAGWRDVAEARIGAMTAFEAISDALNEN